MEFDRSRVYTAVNADELQIGSKCVFADTIQDLQKKVQGGFNLGDVGTEDYCCRLIEIYDESHVERFVSDCEDEYLLAYLVESPQEYKPFSSIQKAKEAIDKHGGWIKKVASGYKYLVLMYQDCGVGLFAGEFVFFEELNERFVFWDDGTPCGELVEG